MRSAYELVNGKSHATTAEELVPYHVSVHEAMCKEADGTPCRDCGGRIYLSFAVLRRFARVRNYVGQAVTIGSGYRCKAHQTRLWNEASQEDRDAGMVAFPGSSPHEFGEAIDTYPTAGYTPLTWGRLIVELNKGDIRVGCYHYPWGAHMDTMFLVRPDLVKGISW